MAALKEMITIGTTREAAVNVTYKVGAGGDNGPADVMLIQTMFRFLADAKGITRLRSGLAPSDLPAITGTCDLKTKRAILKFQEHNARKLLSVDGAIHPASYTGRVIKPGEPRVMTITLMHFLAAESQLYYPERSYIDILIKLEPRLRPWLS